MTHFFDIDHANKYGVVPAIILQNIIWWIDKNKANEKHFHDGRYWTYNSVAAMQKLFPYMTPKQIRKAIDLLRDQDVILTGNYSENKSDRSLWYALVDEGLLPLRASGRLPRKAKGIAQEGKSSISTDSKPDVSVASAPDKQKIVEEKVKTFKQTLYPFVDQYGVPMLKEFADYWGEPTINGTKLKWELEKTWEVKGRLARWHKNDLEKKARQQRTGPPGSDAPAVASDPSTYHTTPRT